MAREKYTTISVSENFMNVLEKHLLVNNKSYTNKAEFIREAVREKIRRDSQNPLDKADLLLKELDSLKKFRKDTRKEIRHIKKQGTVEEKAHLKETSHALDQHMDAKLKKEEKWDKEAFEYQLMHGNPYNIKEMRKNLIRKYKRQKRNIPDWLPAPEEPTVQLSQSKLNEIILQRLEKLEKKDKKKTS